MEKIYGLHDRAETYGLPVFSLLHFELCDLDHSVFHLAGDANGLTCCVFGDIR
jgi:hypothetical protein